MDARLLEPGSEPLSSPSGWTIEWLDEYGTLIVDDRHLERNYAARLKTSKSAPHRVQWISCIHENESSNNCVHGRSKFDFPKIACHKVNVCEALRPSSLLGVLHLGGISVNAGDVTGWILPIGLPVTRHRPIMSRYREHASRP